MKKLFASLATLVLCAGAAFAAGPKAEELYTKIGALQPLEKIVEETGPLAAVSDGVVLEDLLLMTLAPENGDSNLYVFTTAPANATDASQLQLMGVMTLEPLTGVKDEKSFEANKRVRELKAYAAKGGKAVQGQKDVWQKGDVFYQVMASNYEDQGKMVWEVAFYVGVTPYIDAQRAAAAVAGN